MSISEMNNLIDQLGRARILVLGDAMLDRYVWGCAERISPEAPVVVLRADQREVRLGGAASVAMLLSALEARVSLASVVGDDHDGRTLRRLLEEYGINARCVISDSNRPTTVKERFLGRADHRQPHQVLRVDTESCEPIIDAQVTEVLDWLIGHINSSSIAAIEAFDAVLISDYGKGNCHPGLVSEVITVCRDRGIPTLVDPARDVELDIYRHATLIKPNRVEAETILRRTINSPAVAINAAMELRERYDFDYVVITLDRDGLVFATNTITQHLPIFEQSICDITGAGDTVLAVLGLGLAANGMDQSFRNLCELANRAAGIQVAHAGVTPITRHQLKLASDVEAGYASKPQLRNEEKLVSLKVAARLASQYRSAGKKIVLTNGCFDLLHVGHIETLHAAAELGDVLFVAINSDLSVSRLKGQGRPVVNQNDRARTLGALATVNHVLIFDDNTPHDLLEAIRPDILVKGGSTREIVGREVVEKYGGRCVLTKEINNRSTSRLVKKILTTANAGSSGFAVKDASRQPIDE